MKGQNGFKAVLVALACLVLVGCGVGTGSMPPTEVGQAPPSGEPFTGIAGQYVSREETVRGFKEIVEGKHDDKPEQAFYMKGGIDQIG